MKSERIPFQPIGDIDDRLEQLAREKGVSTMVKPDKGEQGAKPAEENTLSVAPTKSEAVKRTATPATIDRPDTEATPRSLMKSVNMELPLYVWTDLKIRAAHKQTSVRHIIMTALKADGIHISDVDMVEDGRRIRGKDLHSQS